ncbi:crossover junction endodeoxyribonuclease RuvC [Alphaproteobacteria bacterium]|nr:crossover junction endodeoxyribonuclease RuvC [Alphaproteobacteria bacterium]
MDHIKVIGIDPGLRITGWGVIELRGSLLKHVAHGTVCSDSTASIGDRLNQIYEQLLTVIDLHKPHEAAIEEVFVNKNPGSSLKLGMARGVCILAPSHRGLSVAEYGANKVKKSIVGVGHADKNQMETMVNVLLPGCLAKKDAADALGVAICHSHLRNMKELSAYNDCKANR